MLWGKTTTCGYTTSEDIRFFTPFVVEVVRLLFNMPIPSVYAHRYLKRKERFLTERDVAKKYDSYMLEYSTDIRLYDRPSPPNVVVPWTSSKEFDALMEKSWATDDVHYEGEQVFKTESDFLEKRKRVMSNIDRKRVKRDDFL